MDIIDTSLMMLLSGGGGGDIAELTVDANGTYEAVNYTNVDGVATLITDPDTQKSLDGFNPVNVQINIEEEKKKAYDEGYSDGYTDGQKDPDPPYKDVVEEIISKPPFTPPTETFSGDDPNKTIDDIIDYYNNHPYGNSPPMTFGVSMDVEGEKTPTGTIRFVQYPVPNSHNNYSLIGYIGDTEFMSVAVGTFPHDANFTDLYVDTNGIAHYTYNWVNPITGTVHHVKGEWHISPDLLIDTAGTTYTVTMHYNYSYNP